MKAEVVRSQGRLWLVVNGYFLAMEGEPCRDPDLQDPAETQFCASWTPEILYRAAKLINEVA